jgi:hypothetical protein
MSMTSAPNWHAITFFEVIGSGVPSTRPARAAQIAV